MAEKREIVRHKKRLSIRFGVGQANRVAFTEDVSRTGMFIKSPNVVPPSSKVVVEFELENRGRVVLEARVIWAKKVPQNLFHLVKKSGMGIHFLRFIEGEQFFHDYCQELTSLRKT